MGPVIDNVEVRTERFDQHVPVEVAGVHAGWFTWWRRCLAVKSDPVAFGFVVCE